MSFQNTENETSNRAALHSTNCLRYSTSRNHLSYRSFCPADISWVIQLTLTLTLKNIASLCMHQTNGSCPSFYTGIHDSFSSVQMSKEGRSPISLKFKDATN